MSGARREALHASYALRLTCLAWQQGKARDSRSIVRDGFKEHAEGPDPGASVAIERPIQHERFQRFAVPDDAKDFVLIALVVPVHTKGRMRKGREI